jgi:hypothetical protein
MTTTILRSVVWRPFAEAGAEHCSLYRLADGFRLEGHVAGAVDDLPLYVHYIVECDGAWNTRRVDVSQLHGAEHSTLQLEVSEERWWTAGGVELPQLQALVDVDLGVTPATNTIPIRRLALAIGQRADVIAAWVRFPELVLEPLPQTYERIAANTYRYTSDGGNFTALLEVDDLGLIVRYEGGWERVATG